MIEWRGQNKEKQGEKIFVNREATFSQSATKFERVKVNIIP